MLREYERGVIFRLGRLIATKGPGLILLIPLIDRMVKVELRTVTLSIPPQEVITRDNVPCRVNAVAYFRVVDQNRAVVEVENYLVATSQISQTALRSVLGKAELDQLLADRERLNEELQKIIDESTEPWGVKVTAVEIKDVEIPEQMQRAMARQAEAERERRAKIINSEGEFQAAQKLTDAADIISTNPASLQLRYLQTLLEIGSNQNTTVVFPLPMDVIEPFLGRADHNRGGSKAKPDAPPPPRRRRPVPGGRRLGPARRQPRRPRRPDPSCRRRTTVRRTRSVGAETGASRPRTIPRPIRICHPPAPERERAFTRDPDRPAQRAADDPRPGPRGAARQLHHPAWPSRRGPRTARSARATRTARRRSSTPCGPTAARPTRPAGGPASSPTSTRRSARPRRATPGGSPEAEAGSFSSSGDPLLTSRRSGEPDLFSARPATGAHEVLINSPRHVTAMAELDDAEFADAVATWRERMRAHADAPYLQLIVNEGGGAGASLEHTHAQLYALPFVPAAVARERERVGAYGERTAGSGLLADVLVEEVRRKDRLVAIDDEAALICPWASRSPFELRVVPRREEGRFEEDGGGAAMIAHRDARCWPSASARRRS